MTDGVIPWPRGESLPLLPPVYEVARPAPGDRSPVVDELIADLVGRFSGLPWPIDFDPGND